jgi:alkylhydroperoxidase family enzyme
VASWLHESASGDTEFERVIGLRPNLLEGYHDFTARLWAPDVLDPTLLERCRLSVARVLNCRSELTVRMRPAVEAGLAEHDIVDLPGWRTGDDLDPALRRVLAFSEQFVADPGGVSGPERAELRRDLGMPGLVALANALALFDGFDRLRLVLGIDDAHAGTVLVDPGPPDSRFPTTPAGNLDDDDPAVAFAAAQPDLFASFQRWYAALWSAGIVDHPSKEVARLRNARVTGCRFCRNVRFSQARADGLHEGMVDLIADGYEHSALPDRHKAVIGLADVFLTRPGGGVPAALRDHLLNFYGPAGVVELTVGLALFMGFSKIAVSLGAFPEDFDTTLIDTPTVVTG